jgi:outer membrane protein OmpA-like peptidoglycan-associated protein
MWSAKKPFTIQIKKQGYFSKAENFDYTLEKSFLLVNRNFFLQTVEKNKAYVLPNINFDQSKSELKPGFEAELEKVILLLSENTQYNLLLEGHTDNQGDWNDNLKLSQERVENVKAYLVSKGIDAKRIQTKGWGGSKPLANNLLEDTRKNNRRVEFTLVPVE